MKRYGAKLSSGRGVYSSTFGDGLTIKQSSIDNGWKWNTSSSTTLHSSAVAFSKSTHRKRFVSPKSVGINATSRLRLCNRPCVVNASERIISICFTFHVRYHISRFTYYVSRFTLHVLRCTFYVAR